MKYMTSLALINQTIETMWESVEEVVETAKDYYEALAGVKRDSVVWGYEFALEALLMFVADRRVERLSRHGTKSGDPAQVLLSIKPFAFTPQA